MRELNFETGLVEFSLNNKCSVIFNPTDVAFVEKLFHTFDELDKKQEGYKSRVEKTANNAEVFEICRVMDAEMRDMINSLFDADICAPVFGSMNVYALADGLPVWSNLMLALMDEVDTSFAREQKATNPRIKKYTAKYHR